MREALSSLTPRGRVLLAGGLTALVCGLVLGLPDLVRVGAFCFLLPLVVALTLGWARYRISLERTTQPPRVPCGQPARVRLRLTNEGFSPPGTVLVEDEVGYALGARPRFRLDSLRRGTVHVHDYRVTSDVRGRHELGPAMLRVSDPLGLVEVHRRFRTTTSLVVLPQILPLTAPGDSAAAQGGHSGRAAALHRSSHEESTVRAYRRGDDVRRVHWRSSARLGELMVRHEDPPHRPATTLLLDVRHDAHRGNGAASSFEAAVRAAASVLVHLHQEGHDLHLVAGQLVEEVPAHDAEALGRALDALAVVTTTDEVNLPLASGDGDHHGRAIVAVLGALVAADIPQLSTWAAHSSRARALVVDVEEWRTRLRERRSVVHVGAASAPVSSPGSAWATAFLGTRTSLDDAWRSVA